MRIRYAKIINILLMLVWCNETSDLDRTYVRYKGVMTLCVT